MRQQNVLLADLVQQKEPSSVQTRQDTWNLSVPAANNYMHNGTQIFSKALQQSLEQDRTPEKRTVPWERFLQQSTCTLACMSTSRKLENGTSSESVSIFESPDCGKSPSENLQHGFISSATSTQKSNLQVKSLAAPQSVTEDSLTNPVQHHCQADLSNKLTTWGSSSKQSMPTSVIQGKEMPHINNFIRNKFEGCICKMQCYNCILQIKRD